jgi:hypothetical protein
MYTTTTNKINWTTHQLRVINIMIQLTKKLYISRDVTFHENKPYFKGIEKEINTQEPSSIFTFLSIEYSGEDEIIITNEGEHEIEEISQIQEEESGTAQTQEEESEIQEDVRGEIEEIPLRRSTLMPQTSTRLYDFITYKVQYSIQNFISYDNILH